jgi:hypothetical protein
MPWAAVEERLPPPSAEGTEFEDAIFEGLYGYIQRTPPSFAWFYVDAA